MGRATVTLSDVAAIAGVSLSTASKALHGSTRISAATRESVAAAAVRLDFRPNALAQSFASGRSRTIGIYAQSALSTFIQPVLIGAIRELGALHHATLLYDAEDDDADGSWKYAQIRELQARRVDGVLVIGGGQERTTYSLTEHFATPVRYANTESDLPQDRAWLPDNHAVGVLATRYLLDAGRTRIAHLGGPQTSRAARLRHDGVVETLGSAGLPSPSAPMLSWRFDSGVEATLALIDSGVAFDALFCANDHLARGAIEALQRRGLKIPDDVAVIGVDNWAGVVIRHGDHHLSTVDLGLLTIGVEAARDLLNLPPRHSASWREQAGQHLMTPELLVGSTT